MKNPEKAFQAMAANYILGECNTIDISGPKEKVECILEVLRSSRLLFLELENKNSTLKEILSLTAKKNLAAQKYKNITGKVWYF